MSSAQSSSSSPAPVFNSEVLQLSYESAPSTTSSTATSSSSASAASAAPSASSSLTPDELAHYNTLLHSQGTCGVRDFFLAQYEKESVKNWDRFYRKNADRFYKDRHYLTQEFKEMRETLKEDRRRRGESVEEEESNEAGQVDDEEGGDDTPAAASSSASATAASSVTNYASLLPITEPTSQPQPNQRTLLEIGCGVGNAMFPLLRLHKDVFFYGMDCSKNAIQVVQNHSDYKVSGRAAAWVVDIVKDPFPPSFQSDSIDFATMIFVLSAIHPEQMKQVLKKVWKCMKKGEEGDAAAVASSFSASSSPSTTNTGGYLFLRDYAYYDLAQLRFQKQSKLGSSWYVRADGTRSYFFTLEEMNEILVQCGFEIIESVYVKKQVKNRKEGKEMNRRFVQVRARAVRRKGDEEEAAAASSTVAAPTTSDSTIFVASGPMS